MNKKASPFAISVLAGMLVMTITSLFTKDEDIIGASFPITTCIIYFAWRFINSAKSTT